MTDNDITVTRNDATVVMRRMDALGQALMHGDVQLTPFAYEQTYKALERVFKIERREPDG